MTCPHERKKLYRGELSCCACGAPLPLPQWMVGGGIERDNVYQLVQPIDEPEAIESGGYARQAITWQDADVLTEKEQLALRMHEAIESAYAASHPAPKENEGDKDE